MLHASRAIRSNAGIRATARNGHGGRPEVPFLSPSVSGIHFLAIPGASGGGAHVQTWTQKTGEWGNNKRTIPGRRRPMAARSGPSGGGRKKGRAKLPARLLATVAAATAAPTLRRSRFAGAWRFGKREASRVFPYQETPPPPPPQPRSPASLPTSILPVVLCAPWKG